MVEQIKNGFEQVVMSEECKQTIESAMLKKLQETQAELVRQLRQ